MTNWPLDHFKYVVTSPLRGLPQLNLTDFPHRVTCLILIGIDQTWNLKIRVEPTQPSKWISTFVYNCTDIKNNKPKNQLLSSYVCLPCQQCCSALKADLVLHKRTIYLPFHATSQSAAQITTCLEVVVLILWNEIMISTKNKIHILVIISNGNPPYVLIIFDRDLNRLLLEVR